MDDSSKLILFIALFIIMMGMGLSLTIKDFKRVLQYPIAVFTGFLNQIILLPVIAYGLLSFLKVEQDIAIGIMILSACPGGPTSNLVTHLAKGDTALSVTLTAINSLITIVTIPLIVNFALGEFGTPGATAEAPVILIMVNLFGLIAVPLTIGMLIRKYKSAFAEKMAKPVRIASGSILILVIVGLIIKERAHFVDYVSRAWLAALLLNISTMTIGFITAKLFRLNFRQALCITIESGNQNSTMAITVAGTLNNPAWGIAAAVYSLFMYATPIGFVVAGNKRALQEKK